MTVYPVRICSRVTFGDITYFFDGQQRGHSSSQWFTHLATDHFLSGNILAVIDYSVVTLNPKTKSLCHVAGRVNESGNVNGNTNRVTLFREIFGLLSTVAEPHTLLITQGNCVRQINRKTNVTKLFAGLCRTGQNDAESNLVKDGPALVARFNSISTPLIASLNQSYPFYLYDRPPKKIRMIFPIHTEWQVVTIHHITTTIGAQVFALSFNQDGSEFYIPHNRGVRAIGVPPTTTDEDIIVATTGDQDGDAKSIGSNGLAAIITLYNNVLVILDVNSRRLRVYNPVEKRVSSICQKSSFGSTVKVGDISECRLGFALHLYKYEKENTILIASESNILALTYNGQ